MKTKRAKTKRGERQYDDNWGKICFQTRTAVGNRCVNCLAKAELVHHFYYRKGLLNRRGYGKEKPLIDIVPLCRRCHGYVHKKDCWIKHKNDPDKDRNTGTIIWSLRIQAWIIAGVVAGTIALLKLLGLRY